MFLGLYFVQWFLDRVDCCYKKVIERRVLTGKVSFFSRFQTHHYLACQFEISYKLIKLYIFLLKVIHNFVLHSLFLIYKNTTWPRIFFSMSNRHVLLSSFKTRGKDATVLLLFSVLMSW